MKRFITAMICLIFTGLVCAHGSEPLSITPTVKSNRGKPKISIETTFPDGTEIFVFIIAEAKERQDMHEGNFVEVKYGKAETALDHNGLPFPNGKYRLQYIVYPEQQRGDAYTKLKEMDALKDYELDTELEIKDSPLSESMEDLQKKMTEGFTDIASKQPSFITFDKVVIKECERGGYTAYVGLVFNQDMDAKGTEAFLKLNSNDAATYVQNNHPEVSDLVLYWKTPHLSDRGTLYVYRWEKGKLTGASRNLGFDLQ